MNFPLFIAKRYLVSKKKLNIINFISVISVSGVAVGTMALIVVLSVFNGFDSIIKSFFNAFDPDIKISLVKGKVFNPNSSNFDKVKKLKGVLVFSEILEEKAIFEYGDKKHIGEIKGVSENYHKLNGIDTLINDGKFILRDKNENFAVIGNGVAHILSISINRLRPIKIWSVIRGKKLTFDTERAFNKSYIFPSGTFAFFGDDYDNKYIITPLKFAQNLMKYKNKVSSIEIKLSNDFDKSNIQSEIKQILGSKYNVKNRYEQHELLFKIMKSEKWAIFLILSFILTIASFNIVSSLTMLIIDKKDDIITLKNLGANNSTIKKIFLFEGWLISVLGAMFGLILGGFISWVQQEYKVIKISGAFIIDAYPVSINYLDFIYTFLTVVLIGFLASWIPIRYISKKTFS